MPCPTYIAYFCSMRRLCYIILRILVWNGMVWDMYPSPHWTDFDFESLKTFDKRARQQGERRCVGPVLQFTARYCCTVRHGTVWCNTLRYGTVMYGIEQGLLLALE